MKSIEINHPAIGVPPLFLRKTFVDHDLGALFRILEKSKEMQSSSHFLVDVYIYIYICLNPPHNIYIYMYPYMLIYIYIIHIG